jgi:hypothetical protein
LSNELLNYSIIHTYMNISTYVQGYRLLVCATVRALELGIEGKRLGIDRSIFNLAGIRSRLLDGDDIDGW